jgi:hypothetical protein
MAPIEEADSSGRQYGELCQQKEHLKTIRKTPQTKYREILEPLSQILISSLALRASIFLL